MLRSILNVKTVRSLASILYQLHVFESLVYTQAKDRTGKIVVKMFWYLKSSRPNIFMCWPLILCSFMRKLFHLRTNFYLESNLLCGTAWVHSFRGGWKTFWTLKRWIKTGRAGTSLQEAFKVHMQLMPSMFQLEFFFLTSWFIIERKKRPLWYSCCICSNTSFTESLR